MVMAEISLHARGPRSGAIIGASGSSARVPPTPGAVRIEWCPILEVPP